MYRLITDTGRLTPGHRAALQLHLLSLDADDRYHRFGMPLSDERLQAWAQAVPLAGGLWWGAWGPADTGLLGALQLAPTTQAHVHELALTVSPTARRQGVGTSLLAAAAGAACTGGLRTLVCEHGHPAVAAMARRLGYSLHPRTANQGLRLEVAAHSA